MSRAAVGSAAVATRQRTSSDDRRSRRLDPRRESWQEDVVARSIARLGRPTLSLALGRANVGDRAMMLEHHDITVDVTRQVEKVDAAPGVRCQHQEVIGSVPPSPIRQAVNKVERVRQVLLARLCDGLRWSAKVAKRVSVHPAPS